MKVLISALTGIALDYAVATARGYTDIKVFRGGRHNERGWIEVKFNKTHGVPHGRYDPGVNPAFAWPIIDAGGITVGPWGTSPAMAHYGTYDTVNSDNPRHVGATMLEAAMRCYLYRIYGATVDVPDSTMAGPHEDQPALALPADEFGKFWYIRKHIPSGREVREQFTPIQDQVFGDPKGVSSATLLAAAKSCIDKWNRQMRDTYHYRLDLIPTLTERA